MEAFCPLSECPYYILETVSSFFSFSQTAAPVSTIWVDLTEQGIKKSLQIDPKQMALSYSHGWESLPQDYDVLPVSVNDCISYVKSMLTLSAFSTLRKIIPRNHIDT